MIELDLPLGPQRKNHRKRIAGIILSVVLLGFGGVLYSGMNSETPRTNPNQSLEEQLALQGHEVALSAAAHSIDRSVMTGLGASDIAAKTERVPPEVAVFEGKKVTIAGTLQRNESVFAALESRNVDPVSIQEVVVATNAEFNFRKKSRPGDKWRAEIDKNGKVKTFRYETTPEHIWETARSEEDQSYEVAKLEVPVETQIAVANGKIKSTLWQALADSAAGSEFVVDFINLFAYTIDFGTETKVGDEFAIVFEKIYLDGEFLRYGEVLAAYYESEEIGERYGFRFDTKEGASYYDENGHNLKGHFLKSPLATVKITSTFGRRFHPVHKKYKQHAGVDYGAPTGTPVQAVASGKVIFAGRKGGYGKVVEIKHKNGYVTQYAHLSKISKEIKNGKKVSPKTVIGNVGQTGTATGPHLHFGMRKGGKYVNPLNVDLGKGATLTGQVLKQYEETVVLPMMMELRNQIASNPDG